MLGLPRKISEHNLRQIQILIQNLIQQLNLFFQIASKRQPLLLPLGLYIKNIQINPIPLLQILPHILPLLPPIPPININQPRTQLDPNIIHNRNRIIITFNLIIIFFIF